MKVFLCALAKNEHLYINEWVAHYVKLGFDKIYIYDNDDKGTKDIYKCIDRQYSKHLVFVNIRGKHFKNMQGKCYTEFYSLHKDMFDYCMFCDIDEFLVGIDNIKTFLSQPHLKNFEQIRVKWKLFGDDNLIERDMNKGVMESFKKEITKPLSTDLKSICNLHNQGKCIIKGHMNNVVFNSVHFASRTNGTMLSSCLPSGRLCKSGVEIKEDYTKEHIYLNHYMTKTLSEFVEQKLNRTDAVFSERQLKLEYFWRINKKTVHKLNFLKNKGII